MYRSGAGRHATVLQYSTADPTHHCITPHPNACSSSFLHLDILFPPNDTLSQQERGLMEDIIRDPDDPETRLRRQGLFLLLPNSRNPS